jgi:GTP:adenosylcobinamide-phosphate guanylyltransferase
MIGIIPAAGYGTRLYELGKEYPKSVLPYKEKPLLVWNVEWLRLQGCDDIRVVVSHQEDKIREVVSQYGLDVTITNPATMGGLSQSVLSGLEVSPASGSVLIVLGDILVDSGQLDYSTNWLSTFEVSDWSRWCMVDSESGIFYDKPKEKPPTNEALSGVYFFRDCVVLANALREQIVEGTVINNELQFSTAIAKLEEPFKTVNLSVKDFGTLANYLKNRGLRNSRSFNEVTLEKFTVQKSSEQRAKIISERNWFQNIPTELAVFTPRILEADLVSAEEASYTMDRVFFPTLRELYLFFDRSEETWDCILDSCANVYQTFASYSSKDSYARSLVEKTEKRVIEGGLLTSYTEKFLEDFKAAVAQFERGSQLMHGDFCFSNLFWNDANRSVLMVDPRGDLYGSKYYDWAKLRHSAMYNYDFIDAELYTICDDEVTLFDSGTSRIGELLREKELALFSEEEISYLELLTASLFLSMIPLHSHSTTNQNLFYRKFVKIYENWRS